MLILNLPLLARGEVQVEERIAPDHPIWEGADIPLAGPVDVSIVAREVGGGSVLVQATVNTSLLLECRRCIGPVRTKMKERIDLFFEEDGPQEAEDEVYPLPERGTTLDLSGPIREQVILRIPRYVVCAESCQGLCPQCGIDLNVTSCECVPPADPGPWDALKKLEFD